MKLLHIITALNVGGAETMLAKLVEQPLVARHPIRQEVLSLVKPGPMAERIRAQGVPLHSLDMREGILTPRAAIMLARIVRAVRPDLILGWMHHGHLAASVAALSVRPRPPMIWNIRRSLTDIHHEKPLTRGVLRLCAALSAQPDAILYNSHAARAQYERFGYKGDRAQVVPNGFDCRRFAPRADARCALTAAFAIEGEPLIVGMVARAHPMKDPQTLVEAVRRVRQRGRDVHLLIAGKGMAADAALKAAAESALPANRLTIADQRTDVAEWLPGLDVLALPSAWGEGFPNIIGEAMASGVPCVATDIGDSGWIIGAMGQVVPPRDPEAMAEALLALDALGADGRHALGLKARARVIDHFSIADIAARYGQIYDAVLDAHRRNGQPREAAHRAVQPGEGAA